MLGDVALYVKQSLGCQQSEASNQKREALHTPLEVPIRLWEHVHMDLITSLPSSKPGQDAIPDKEAMQLHSSSLHDRNPKRFCRQTWD